MAERPNVVWLTLESTRQDHTTMGNHGRDTTPRLAALADRPDARAYDACFSHGIWTLSSSASILTGTAPSAHGTGMANDAVPADLRTVPERLAEVGYHTACLSPNPHLSTATGLDRGFEEFTFVDKGSLVESVGLRSLARYGLNVRRHGGGLSTDTRRHTPDFVLTDLLKRRLGAYAGAEEPFFAYAHLAGPHHPYFPPRRFRERYCGDLSMGLPAAGEVALDHHERLWEHVAAGSEFSPPEWAAIEGHYDGEIAHVDELVGRVLDRLDALETGPTVVVVTGDHGEYFGEESLLGHNLGVHDAVCHVPLVVAGVDGLDGWDGVVQHADVVQTLLGMADADAAGTVGVDLRDGEREYAVVQRGGERARKRFGQLREHDPDYDVSRFHDGTLTALRDGQFKYRHSEGRAELLALPDETADAGDAHPEVRERMAAASEEWLSTAGQPLYEGRAESAFTPAMEEQLADLGYLVD